MIEHEIAEFGRRLGIAHLEFNEQDLISLHVADVGDIFLEKKGETLFLTLAEEGEAGAAAYEKLLRIINWRRLPQLVVTAGIAKGRRMLVTRMEAEKATAAGLENALRLLMQIMKTAV